MCRAVEDLVKKEVDRTVEELRKKAAEKALDEGRAEGQMETICVLIDDNMLSEEAASSKFRISIEDIRAYRSRRAKV